MSRVCISGITDYAGFDASEDTNAIGYINPIRYRGYYYDNETGFYYLQSRYYDPVVGTLKDWHDGGETHPCTIAIKSIVIKWEG